MPGTGPHPGMPPKDWMVPREPQAAGRGWTLDHYPPWFLTITVTMSIPWYFWWLTEDA